MNLIINGRNVEITEWIEEYVEKKIGKLERFVSSLDEARAELTQSDTRSDSDRYTFQITIWASKQILRAEETTGDIFASIDAAIEKIARQIERVEGRRKKRRRTSTSMNSEMVLEATALLEELEEEAEENRIVRRKHFVLQPLDEEEAQEQMELLGHDFFLYYNPDAKAVNLIYRRKDGNYGLLEPTIV